MKFLLIISFCVFTTYVCAQKNTKLLLSGSPSNQYLTHQVSAKDSYITLAEKYNLSPVAIANYNNLEFHKGKLSAKYLKVPLSKKNFLLTDKPVSKALAVYKNTTGRLRVVGYVVNSKSIAVSPKPLATPPQQPQTTKKEADERPVVNTENATAPAITEKATVTTKATKKIVAPPKPTKDWIKRVKQKKQPQHFGPGKFIQEFYIVAIFISIITLVLIVAIFSHVFLKRKTSSVALQLKHDIITGLSEAILHSKNKEVIIEQQFVLPSALTHQLKLPQIRQLLIDEVIKATRSFRGQGAENLIRLYEQLGLQENSLKKLSSKHWYIKAKGIQELAALNQKQYLFKIFRLTNSRNENVRTEAQSAIVHFAGFSGLRFLKVLTFPISDWQQMKLIEQLGLLSEPDLPSAKQLLKSNNDSVVIFILKLISVFHLLHLHDAVVGCLYYRSPTIRFYAIKCLQQIYNQSTAATLENFYVEEELKNKIAILEAIKVMGTNAQTDFIYLELFNKNDTIKLMAAEALMTCCNDGLQLISDVSTNNGHPYTNIFNHVRKTASLS